MVDYFSRSIFTSSLRHSTVKTCVQSEWLIIIMRTHLLIYIFSFPLIRTYIRTYMTAGFLESPVGVSVLSRTCADVIAC